MCGTMMPTKPISPETATAAAVPSEAAAIEQVAGSAAGAAPRLARLVVADREHVELAAVQQHDDAR